MQLCPLFSLAIGVISQGVGYRGGRERGTQGTLCVGPPLWSSNAYSPHYLFLGDRGEGVAWVTMGKV